MDMDVSPFDLSHQNQNVDSKLVAALERISQVFRVLLWNEGKELGLSPIQIQVLIFLLYHPAEKRKVSYLAQEFTLTKATISDTIKTLDQKGLITKEYEPHDTRSYSIHLTSTGKELAERTSHFARDLQIPIAQLPFDDKETLLQSLLFLIHRLTQTGVVTLQRMCFTCAHYRASYQGHTHFCALLQMPLPASELRVDCPEHLSTV